MITIEPYLEFYITHVCNLSCNGCNRFNNYKFKGHQKWADHEAEYAKWAARITAPFITIIGGEPTLNPDLENFAAGIRKLWPTSQVMIQTNGTQTKKANDFLWRKYRVGFGVSLHDHSTAADLTKTWQMYSGVIDSYDFHQAAIIDNADHFTLHASDPVTAFSVCDMKHSRTMFDGKLYKCPAMATIPEFKKQFDLRMSPADESLLHNYAPLSADCTEEELQAFYHNRDVHVPQCKFCPQNLIWGKAIPIELASVRR